MSSVEDWNVGVWQNTGVTNQTTYQPFNPYATPVPTTKPKDLFGGGSGGGVTVTPIAFLVITAAGDVRLMQVSGDSNNAGRALNMIPEVIDKVVGLINQKKNGALILNA